MQPPPVFRERPLEDVLARLGSDLCAPRGAAPTLPAGTRPRVLHVATQLYGTGGHTQMLSSWLRLDRAREHHVCVTGQEGRDVPDKISRVLAGPDALTLLDDGRPRLLDRAARLRELALDHDQVVLHVHPNDVVPAIALALPPGERPEVLLVNHADHVFWVGVHVADRIVNLRTSGARLNVERRGIPEARNALLVRPLVMRDRRLSRSAARAELGLPPDALVVASAADTYKYGAAGGETLLDVLLPVMRAHPEARLHVAGPEPDGDWSVLAAEGLGRAWGLLPNVHTLLEAADVYVDSHPFSSLTSMLEAAWLDTPVLTLRSPDERLGVLGADTPARRRPRGRGIRPGAGAQVDRLLADADARNRVGASAGAAVRRFHADGAWAELAGKILDAPPAAGPASAPGSAVRDTGPLDQRLLQVMGNGVGQGLAGTLDVVSPLLSWPRRVETAARLLRTGRVRPALLLPRGAASRIRKARTAVGRVRASA